MNEEGLQKKIGQFKKNANQLDLGSCHKLTYREEEFQRSRKKKTWRILNNKAEFELESSNFDFDNPHEQELERIQTFKKTNASNLSKLRNLNDHLDPFLCYNFVQAMHSYSSYTNENFFSFRNIGGFCRYLYVSGITGKGPPDCWTIR